MVFFVFLLDFRIVQTVWYFFVFLLDFRIVQTVWYFLLFILLYKYFSVNKINQKVTVHSLTMSRWFQLFFIGFQFFHSFSSILFSNQKQPTSISYHWESSLKCCFSMKIQLFTLYYCTCIVY